MPEYLAGIKTETARPSGATARGVPGTLGGMPRTNQQAQPPKPKKTKKAPASELKLAVRARLRAIQAEIGLPDEGMAALIGRSRQAWSNWVGLGPEMPAEEAMILLCDQIGGWNLTLDWIYRGKIDLLAARIAIRLSARVMGLNPDTAGAEVLDAAMKVSAAKGQAIETVA